MSTRASWIAWSLWGLALVLAACGLLFGVLALPADLPKGREPLLVSIIVQDVLVVLYGVLGALISSRHRRNSIGWIFCFVAVSLGILSFAYGYADYALYVGDEPLPGAELAAWVTNWLFVAAVFVMPCYLFFLFPNGRPASARWRLLMLAVSPVVVVAIAAPAFEPGPMVSFPTEDNPLGLEDPLGGIVIVANDVTDFAAVPVFLVSLASMVVRLRRSRGIERQQIKWVAYAATLTATSFAVSFLASPLTDGRAVEDVFFLLGVLGFVALPVAAGVAILRHRLYGIDALINRTLVYGALTAMLAAVYLGSVAVLQYVFRVLAGGDSSLAIVASTLAIAALFNPLRRRVQASVDRRFYRRKYDAAKTLGAFSDRLRDGMDLGALRKDLVAVAREAVQPEHVSLWLAPDLAGRAGKGGEG